jgi:peptidoglycan/xylan/chitin deacetylase (PgdA/CDA1 family)
MNRLARVFAARLWLLKDQLLPASWSRPGVRILIFHHVRAHEEPGFARLVDFLLDRNELAEPDEIGRTDLSTTKYVLSFDDGYRSNHSLARRLLAPRKVRALFCVCSGLVGQVDALPLVDRYMFPGIHVAEEVKRELHFMSWEQVIDLAEAGHTIASHSMKHRRLSELDAESDLREEIVTSGDLLADRLKRPVRWFAYPFGDLDSINERALDLIGRRYDYCLTGIRGLNRVVADRRGLFREHVDLGASFAFQLMASRGGLDVAYVWQRRQFDRMFPVERSHSTHSDV